MKQLLLTFMLVTIVFSMPVLSEENNGDSEIDTLTTNNVFTIGRFTTCKQVKEHQPVDVTSEFSLNDNSLDENKIYAYLEANQITEDTSVTFAWLFDGEETSRYTVDIKKGVRWRTYAYKIMNSTQKGPWEVRLLNNAGSLITTLKFTVD